MRQALHLVGVAGRAIIWIATIVACLTIAAGLISGMHPMVAFRIEAAVCAALPEGSASATSTMAMKPGQVYLGGICAPGDLTIAPAHRVAPSTKTEPFRTAPALVAAAYIGILAAVLGSAAVLRRLLRNAGSRLSFA